MVPELGRAWNEPVVGLCVKGPRKIIKISLRIAGFQPRF